jgi:hypothetical protein
LAGIEKTRIVEGFVGNNPLDLHYMPYTHSVGMSLVWAIGAALILALCFASRLKQGPSFSACRCFHIGSWI